MTSQDKDKQKKMKELTDKLEQGIKDVYESDRYKNYLAVMSKFHSYSFRNSLLIMLQKPEATHVAGFNAWQKAFNRSVNKGEKGIQILAPTPYRARVKMDKLDPITQTPILDSSGKPVTELVEITKPAFRPVYVFDVSQTSGEPLPQLITELAGSIPQYQAFFESLKSVSPFPMQFEDIQSGAKGYCDPVNRKIAIKTGMSEIQNIKTAIHEITHADLHANQVSLSLDARKDRRTKEVEAESVAFVVCSQYGIDTSDYSFAYVASWSSDKELNELKSSLDTIQKQAAELISRIDTRFHELLAEQPILPVPDDTLTVSDMEKYGYQFYDSNKMLPLGSEKAVELFDKNPPFIYLLYKDDTEALAEYKERLLEHFVKGGMAGINLEDWEDILKFEAGVYYGKVDFLGNNGNVGETIFYKDKESFDKEVSESRYIGRPITCQVYDTEDQARHNEYNDSVKFDNDIDLDKEKTRKQLGFKDSAKPITMNKRMTAAKQAAKERSTSKTQNADPSKEKRHTREREER